jgi:hypothetical protein
VRGDLNTLAGRTETGPSPGGPRFACLTRG